MYQKLKNRFKNSNLYGLIQCKKLFNKINDEIDFKNEKNFYLLPNENNLSRILLLVPIYLGILKKGYKIGIYLPLRSINVLPIYLFLGITRFHFISKYNLTISNKLLRDRKLIYKSLNFKEIIEAHLRRVFKVETTKNVDAFTSKKINLKNDIVSTIINWEKINFSNVNGVFFTDLVYYPQGPISQYMKKFKKNINLYSYNVGHVRGAFVLNKIIKNERNKHPYSPKLSLYEHEYKKYNSQKQKKLIKEISIRLFEFYNKSEWYSTVATSSYQDGSKLSQKNKGIKRVALFPHIYWDSSVFWGNDIYSDYRNWFEESLKFLIEETESQIIVKDHPANLSKYLEANEIYFSPVEEFINSFTINQQKRIIYLKPSTKVSALNVISSSDCVLTVRGTIGIESSVLGINTICAGTGRYDNYGFANFPKSIIEYKNLIKKSLENSFKLNQDEQFRAALYLKILWDKMTVYSSFLDIEFDNKNKNRIKVKMKNIDEKEIYKNIEVVSKRII
tara:strand:+ start:137 stop:1651 length:1515 start_codon:yes stop_codon:yes gene_type:complete